MMARKVLILTLGIVLIAAGMVAAANKIGTAGAQQLRVPVGTRGVAMGGAVIADAEGPEALFWNPAGAAGALGTQACLSYKSYIADMTVSYVAITSQFSYGTIGVSAKVLSLGDIYVTTADDWNGTGEIYSINMPVLGLTYSNMLTDRVAFGATAMYLSEAVMQSRAQGMAFDFGFQYLPGWRTLRLGMVMKNYGPKMTYSGPDFEVSTLVPGDDPESANRTVALTSSGFEMPSYFEFGMSYVIDMGLNGTTTVEGAFQSNNFSEDEYRVGVEYSLGGRLYVRGGYVLCDQEKYMYGPSLGIGAKFNLGQATAAIDYSHTFVADYFDDVPEIALKVGL
jgi:hypothetical protein